MEPHWLTVFLDFAPDEHAAGTAYWQAVTGYALSPARGDHGQFASLLPPDGDAHLRIQRQDSGPSQVHLDLHVTDPGAAADRAVPLGAAVTADETAGYGHVLMTSPGGLPFCFVPDPDTRRPGPTRWPEGHRSLVDQLCVDVPSDRWQDELDFWAALTGWPLVAGSFDGFVRLRTPAALPVRILLQRLDEPTGDVRAHLDIATDDRPAETARHERLGAGIERVESVWTVLRSPTGQRYCLTDRDPAAQRG